jgi:hypothetical protein
MTSPLLEIEACTDLERSHIRTYGIRCAVCNLFVKFDTERELVTRWQVEEFPDVVKAVAARLGTAHSELVRDNEDEVAAAREHNEIAENIEMDVHRHGLRELKRMGCSHAIGPAQPAIQPKRGY